MQKYIAKCLIDYCVDAISTVYECLQEMVDPDLNSDIDNFYGDKYDLIISNPPYIEHHKIASEACPQPSWVPPSRPP